MAASSHRRSPRGASHASTRAQALHVAGVIDVLTHENRPRMAGANAAYKDDVGSGRGAVTGRSTTTGSCSAASRSRWSSPRTEIAQFAASLVRVDYDAEAHVTDMYRPRGEAFAVEAPANPAENPFTPPKAARRRRDGLRRGRGAPRGRILCPDRASQPDGALCLDGDLRAGRQAHDLRQDPGRAERPALCLQRARDGAGRGPRHVALHGRRVRLRAAPAIPGRAGSARGARAQALGAGRADPRSRCTGSATGRP